MNWFKKVKEKIMSFFKSNKVAPAKEVATTALAKPKETTLNKLAKENLALAPAEIPISKQVDNIIKQVTGKCSHSYSLKKQVWTKVAKNKFELQNELVCSCCHDKKVQPIT